MNISIAIADANTEYVDRLSEVLQQYNDLSIFIYTNVEKLEEAIVKKHFDVVLFDADFCDRRIAFLDTKLPICFFNEESANLSLYLDIAKVRKYQRISNIYKDIVRLYADKAGISSGIDQSQNTKILAVYSPIGGSGKTTVALSAALKLMDKGNQVLFLSAEQLSSSAHLNPHIEEGITALLSCMNDKNVNFELKLKGLVKMGVRGLLYVEGFNRIVDYLDVKPEEMLQFFEMIKKIGSYNMLVIDMGTAIDGIAKAIFDLADSILVVDKPGEFSNLKMDLFAQQSIVTEYEKKMFRILNFAETNAVYSQKVTMPRVGAIHNYGNLQESSLVQVINTNNEIAVENLFQ